MGEKMRTGCIYKKELGIIYLMISLGPSAKVILLKLSLRRGGREGKTRS